MFNVEPTAWIIGQKALIPVLTPVPGPALVAKPRLLNTSLPRSLLY